MRGCLRPRGSAANKSRASFCGCRIRFTAAAFASLRFFALALGCMAHQQQLSTASMHGLPFFNLTAAVCCTRGEPSRRSGSTTSWQVVWGSWTRGGHAGFHGTCSDDGVSTLPMQTYAGTVTITPGPRLNLVLGPNGGVQASIDTDTPTAWAARLLPCAALTACVRWLHACLSGTALLSVNMLPTLRSPMCRHWQVIARVRPLRGTGRIHQGVCSSLGPRHML